MGFFFSLGQEKPLHNGCVSSLCLPSFQELAGVQDSEAILRRGAQHQAQQQQQQHSGLQCLEPRRASREGQRGTGHFSPSTSGAGCGFWRMYINESTASVQQHARDAFKNTPDLNKTRPDSDRRRWTAFLSYLLLHRGTSGCEAE